MPTGLRNGLTVLSTSLALGVVLWLLAVFVPSTPEGVAGGIAAAAGLAFFAGIIMTLAGLVRLAADRIRR
jgi:hypothetical protein